jgi:cellulose synthase/poly-beta-1,6-N-acetylglucosamine synthase-like glycosyltransferase
MGFEAVELDMTEPFSAARARNAGYAALVRSEPATAYVQFVDGDCELVSDWLAIAHAALANRLELAAVAGRLRERAPEASIYNRMGEMEWNFLGSGDVGTVGGIFMVRREAFDSVGGFDPTVCAGEEPELCQRLGRAGWVITRLGVDMAWHDLAMRHFGQWWRRQIRTGYGGLDVANRFGLPRFRRNNLRARFWSAWPFLTVLAGAGGNVLVGVWPASIAALAILSLWPLQMARIGLRTWRQGQPSRVALAYAIFTMISFWPQMLGQMQYWLDRARRRAPRLIEYKAVMPAERARSMPGETVHDHP